MSDEGDMGMARGRRGMRVARRSGPLRRHGPGGAAAAGPLPAQDRQQAPGARRPAGGGRRGGRQDAGGIEETAPVAMVGHGQGGRRHHGPPRAGAHYGAPAPSTRPAPARATVENS
ncbi:hypothetical protein [Gluconacetobacter diazotrophicus]|uniref:hypothetical protein n=1 Tax=Gluconacetobacter diazotrophicus TaxID=33996 RepID=UPI002ADE6542|nr:hypothetical protein [Gluconacetobacter diazotrophicus]